MRDRQTADTKRRLKVAEERLQARSLVKSKLPAKLIEADKREIEVWEAKWEALGYKQQVEAYYKLGVKPFEECYRSSNHVLAEAAEGKESNTRYVKAPTRRRKKA